MVIQAYKISLFKTMSIGCIAGIDANISSIPSVFILYCMVPFGHFSLMLALKETHPRKCGCSRNHHFITVLPLYIFRTRPPKIIDSSTIGLTGFFSADSKGGSVQTDQLQVQLSHRIIQLRISISNYIPPPPKDSDFFEKMPLEDSKRSMTSSNSD